MKYVKLRTKTDVCNNIVCSTTFEIYDEWETKCLKDELLSFPESTKVESVELDTEERNEIKATHDFYHLSKIDMDGEEREDYIAVPHYLAAIVKDYPATIEIELETLEGSERAAMPSDLSNYDNFQPFADVAEMEEYIDDFLSANFGEISGEIYREIVGSVGVRLEQFIESE